MAMNEWENDNSDILQPLYSVYEKLGQLFFHTYSSNVINIWTSS